MEKEFHKNSYYLQDENSIGRVQIADDVVAVIAGLAATEVKGVAAIGGNLTADLLSKVSSSKLSKGVKVIIRDKSVKIRLAIMMEYGYNIPATCSKVQDKVKAAVENMAGLKVTDVDIRIVNVDIQKEKGDK
ncbi:MAG: Asp23/Gls24 family envelope stress response protein [Lachnospiraceae bacterium]|nr:Asp23/Gls24 family envelope stress response protein [Lachnospiraceae bacterium]